MFEPLAHPLRSLTLSQLSLILKQMTSCELENQSEEGRACTSLRVIRSSSASVRSLGSQRTPPLAPPKGTSTTAVFQVVRLARLHHEIAEIFNIPHAAV